ncbi:MAG: NAD-dependent epimerase/dehydratase family protein [Rhodococcus sp. (in: high G+C Gram-positive bacteria)]|uniref:NAD-dependent epimerase/dehydratase family protein n=1 Tax=Rhodococcus sp. TaxID=1831 RepID=UPI002AD75226|nr:NAD-dependent epimerase/dehydratase family protein [Rhodococcus sp. (in: high G+C Gram-positive bacteria)]
MRIVVIGATGNAGSAILAALARERPGDSVVGIARRSPTSGTTSAHVEWVPLDLTCDIAPEQLRSAFRHADVVIHLAIAFQPMRDRTYLRKVNVDAVRTVSSICAETGVAQLIHMSSGGIYAPGAYGIEVDESWPRTGVPSSTYSCDKAAAEFVLDEFETDHPEVAVARIRPGLIGQYRFGSAVMRYALPDVVPSAIMDHLPLLPLDRSFAVPAVHSDDVADAVVRILDRRASGAYNLGSAVAVRAQDVAKAFGARIVPVPQRALSLAARVAFDAHLSPVHHGWVDLAFATPMLNSNRARRELEWNPRMDGPEVLHEVVRGMREQAGAGDDALRQRTTMDRLRSFGRRGFISRGKKP